MRIRYIGGQGGLHSLLPLFLLLSCVVLLAAPAGLKAASPGDAQSEGSPPGLEQQKDLAKPTPPSMILGVTGKDGKEQARLELEIGNELLVKLDGNEPLNAAEWTLVLDGREIPDLVTAVRDLPRGLVFTLLRTEENRAAWVGILNPPKWRPREVEVSVLRATKDSENPKQRLVGSDPKNPVIFYLEVVNTIWTIIAVLIVGGLLWGVCIAANRTAMLRDGLLPQIPPLERQYSLGRMQMAFWFVLVMVSFLFLWALLWDYNTLTGQTLTMMGIASATGLGALFANTSNDADLKAADTALRANGFNVPGDIESLRTTILDKQKKLDSEADSSKKDTLQSEIDILVQREQIYIKNTENYTTVAYNYSDKKHIYRNILIDITSDRNGPALHRLQLVSWTLVLGVVFLAGVYRDLSMPAFGETLLALMTISGASYVGFKFPEKA